jgi:hypothetical protein
MDGVHSALKSQDREGNEVFGQKMYTYTVQRSLQ